MISSLQVQGGWRRGGPLPDQRRQHVGRLAQTVPFALAVDVVHVSAGVTDEAHTGFLRDPLGLHGGDQGGTEAVEALLRLAALTGGRTLGVDAGLLHDLDELRADPSTAA